MTAVIVLAVVTLVASGIAYVAQHHRERQRARLRAIAEANGLQIDLEAKPPPTVDFDLCDVGSSKKVSTQMWRPCEQDSVCQHQYTVKSGNNSTSTYEFTAAMIELPFSAPHMIISTESWWSKDQARRRAERHRGRITPVQRPLPRPLLGRAVCDLPARPGHDRLMLSPASGHGAVTFELLGPQMLRHGSRLKPEELPEMLASAQSVRTQLPVVLTDLYGRS